MRETQDHRGRKGCRDRWDRLGLKVHRDIKGHREFRGFEERLG